MVAGNPRSVCLYRQTVETPRRDGSEGSLMSEPSLLASDLAVFDPVPQLCEGVLVGFDDPCGGALVNFNGGGEGDGGERPAVGGDDRGFVDVLLGGDFDWAWSGFDGVAVAVVAEGVVAPLVGSGSSLSEGGTVCHGWHIMPYSATLRTWVRRHSIAVADRIGGPARPGSPA
jgi:hypothetical protein